jgi:lysophospholipase L1-like esterase
MLISPRMDNRRLVFRILVLIAVSVVCLSAVEWVLRSDHFLYESDNPSYVQTHELQETDFFKLTGDPALPYRISANASRAFWWGAVVVTNEQGYLGDARSEPGRVNILCAGDSVTFGLGVEQDQTYPEVLRQLIPKARISVLAAPGYNVINEVEWIRRVVESGQFRPQVVILQLGLNDHLHPTRIVGADVYRFYQRIPSRTLFDPAGGPARFLLEYSQLWFRLNHVVTGWLEGRVELHDYPDNIDLVSRSVARLGALAEIHGFTVILVKLPYYRETPREVRFGDSLTSLSSDFDHVLDLTPNLRGNKQFWYDRMHPNAAGHRQIAERLLPHLTRILSSDPG